jgi:hypothetical protein
LRGRRLLPSGRVCAARRGSARDALVRTFSRDARERLSVVDGRSAEARVIRHTPSTLRG